jgi:ribonuclease VapC
MVVDSSALVAIVRKEPESARFLEAIRQAFPRLIAAPTAVEASVVMLARFGDAGMVDCISYALSKATGEPLLFKGDDFSQTDIKRALGGMST